MSYDIGTAHGVIEMEYNGRGIDKAKEELEQLDDKGKKAGVTLQDTGRTAGRAGALVAAGLGLAIGAAANFEERMSAVEAVSGATSGEMDKLSDKALQLGADTKYSATEAASAMEELVKAGLSVDDVLNGAADATVALAAAGEIALPEAATIASNAMNQFGIKAEGVTKVADLLAGAANASAIGVSDIGQSMSQVGAVANLAGVSFEDTATAIALMGNAGIKGSDAGTSLKSMLMRLQPTTEKQGDLMRSLGIITEDGANKFYDAQGNLKSFDKVAGILNTTLGFNRKSQEEVNKAIAKGKDPLKAMADEAKKSGKQQQFMRLQTLFGSDAIRAASIMANEGTKGFRKMNGELKKTTAAEVAAKRMDNFKGRLEELKGSAETVGIKIGTALLPMIEKLVEYLSKATDWFLSLSDGQQKFIAVALTTIAAVLLIVAAIVKIIIIAGKVQIALAALRGTFIATWLAALGPIGLIIIAVALVIAIIVLLWKRCETFRNIVKGAWNAVRSATVTAFKAVVNAIKTAWAFVKGATSATASAVKSAWNSVKTATTAAWNAVKNTISSIWEKVVTAISTKITQIITKVKSIKDKVLEALSGAKTWLTEKGAEIIQGLIDGILGMIDKVKGAVSKVADAVGRFIPGSPVKEGPLKKLNRGYAGKEIVRMVIGGIDSMTKPLAGSLETVMPTPTGKITVSPTGTVKKKGGGDGGPRLIGISGDLTLVGSRAYITGIAEDVFDRFDDDNDRRGGM